LRKSDEGNESTYRLFKVWLELSLGSVGGRTNGSSNGDLDSGGSSLEEDEKSLHEEGEVVDNIVTKNLEVRVETCAGILLGGLVDNEIE
jgi:hypothetical protein